MVVDALSLHQDKVINFALYAKLRKISDPLADIVLESPVLNHLTPRALDLEDAVDQLNRAGIPMQTAIQGPPLREDGVPIQLNQIARIAAGEDVFVALDPAVLAAHERDPGSLAKTKANAPRLELRKGENVTDYMARIERALAAAPVVIIPHKARFGEIEARGVALTVEGEAAYHAYGIEGETDPVARKAKVGGRTRPGRRPPAYRPRGMARRGRGGHRPADLPRFSALQRRGDFPGQLDGRDPGPQQFRPGRFEPPTAVGASDGHHDCRPPRPAPTRPGREVAGSTPS